MFLDSYAISLAVFLLVTINVCIDQNYRLLELGAAVDNVSRGRLIWFYFSATFLYLFFTILALFLIFALITVIIVVIIGIISIVKSGGEMNKGASKDEILKNMSAGIIKAISKYVKSNIEYIYSFLVDTNALIGFLVIFPIFVLIFILAFALSIYQPTTTTSTEDDESSPKSLVMKTLHHYLYYLFVVFLLGCILFVVYQHFMSSVKP